MVGDAKLGMQLSFEQLHRTYDQIKRIMGIVHIGACTAEERDVYASCGIDRVKWFEANPHVYPELFSNIERYPHNAAFCVLLSDVDDELVDFYVTLNKFNGRSASSSMLKLDKHLEHHPNVIVDEIIQLKTCRFDTFIQSMPHAIEHCNFLNIDVQGAELKVLKGIGNCIENFDYVYSEINTASLYEGCVLLPELEDYLAFHGFIRRETNMTPYEWGDALWVRRELIQ